MSRKSFRDSTGRESVDPSSGEAAHTDEVGFLVAKIAEIKRQKRTDLVAHRILGSLAGRLGLQLAVHAVARRTRTGAGFVS